MQLKSQQIPVIWRIYTDITGIFLPPICRNMEAIFMLYYIIFILLGDLCEVKFSGRIIVVKSVSSREIKVPPNSRFATRRRGRRFDQWDASKSYKLRLENFEGLWLVDHRD